MSTDPREPYRVRASDAEREEFATIVRAAMTEGRLTLEEGEERLAQVYAAKYRDELSPLNADLPGGGRRPPHENPELMADLRRGARRHIGVVAAVAAVLVGLWAVSGAHFFWPVFPLLFLWFGVLRHLRWRRWMARGGPRWGGPGFGGHGSRWGNGPGFGGPRDGGWGNGPGFGGPPWARRGEE